MVAVQPRDRRLGPKPRRLRDQRTQHTRDYVGRRHRRDLATLGLAHEAALAEEEVEHQLTAGALQLVRWRLPDTFRREEVGHQVDAVAEYLRPDVVRRPEDADDDVVDVVDAWRENDRQRVLARHHTLRQDAVLHRPRRLPRRVVPGALTLSIARRRPLRLDRCVQCPEVVGQRRLRLPRVGGGVRSQRRLEGAPHDVVGYQDRQLHDIDQVGRRHQPVGSHDVAIGGGPDVGHELLCARVHVVGEVVGAASIVGHYRLLAVARRGCRAFQMRFAFSRDSSRRQC